MAEFAKFDVHVELIDLAQSAEDLNSSSLLAFLKDVAEASETRGTGPSSCKDQITLHCQLIVDRAAMARPASTPPALDLTRRQTEIAYMLERGLTNKEIANTLNISQATVKNHVHAILDKLDLDRRSKVARPTFARDREAACRGRARFREANAGTGSFGGTALRATAGSTSECNP